MKPSDLFGVVIRTCGFLITIYGLWDIWGGIENVVENLFVVGSDDQTSSFAYFALGIPTTVVGIIVFFVADLIVRVAYGRAALADEGHQAVVQRPAAGSVPPTQG